MNPDRYVEDVLRAYEALLEGRRCHPLDRRVAAAFYRRGIPLEIVRAALLVGTARRRLRPAGAVRLAPVRSLAYFLPIVEELRLSSPDPDYLDHLRWRLGLVNPTQHPASTAPS